MLDRIYYYTDLKGRSPVEDFIRGLLPDERQKVFSYIQLLKEKGHQLRRPIADYVCDDIYELRPKGIRAFYFFFLRNNAVLVHSIRKKTNEISARDIKLALQRKEDFTIRFRGGGYKYERK